MKFRIGKPTDAYQLASIHKGNNSNNFGIFYHLPKYILTVYYFFLLQSPSSLVLVAQKGSSILGYTSATLDASDHKKYMISGLRIIIFGVLILPYLVIKPALMRMIYKRSLSYLHGDGKGAEFISSDGARGEYWVWSDPETSMYAGILNNKQLRILLELGIKKLFFEVDAGSKSYEFSLINGAVVSKEITLGNGMVRYFMYYDLKKKFKEK